MARKFGLWAALVLVFVGLALMTAKYSETAALRKAEQAQFEESLKQAELTLEQTRASLEVQQQTLKESRERLAKLQDTLRKHDLARLAAAKPCLIAKRMTAATRKAYGRMAESTGAVLEEAVPKAAPKVCSK